MEDVSRIVASCNVPNSSRNHSSVKRKATEIIAVTSLALHIYWTTTSKDGRKHDFWFVKRRVCVSSLMVATLFFFCSTALSFPLSLNYILWLCILSMVCISRTCGDYIRITYIHEDDKGIRNFNHLNQKVNLKHIILSEPLLSLLFFFALTMCKPELLICFPFPLAKD